MSYLEELNPAQREAVEHLEGPCMIIAGPGSGKTRVLTYRIAHLIREGVDPFNILALTFTNKAASEMRKRIERIVGTEARNLFIGTFHSVFARLLRRDAPRLGYPNNFTIYDTDDSKNVLKNLVKEAQLNDKLYKPNILLNRISQAKNSLIDWQAYQANPEFKMEDTASKRPQIGKIYEAYSKRCFRSGAMDFDDLLFNMYRLLNEFPEVLYQYQHKFKQLLIDEFQDTNFAQYEIVKKIAAATENICVVGDDAQSIYAFRGATIANILNFERDYPDLKTFKLEQNYRSTKNIVSLANEIIKNNKEQLEKTIWTENDVGEPIQIIKAASDNEEGRIIADHVFQLKMQKHFKHEDFAILYRTNAQSRAFEEALRRLNIPYVIYGGISFYQRKEVKDLVAYLRLVVNPKDEEALRRVINYPTRGIGAKTLDKISELADTNGISMWDVCEQIMSVNLPSRTKNGIYDFSLMIKSFIKQNDGQNAFELASEIAKRTGILRELYSDQTVEGIARYENLQELLNGIKEFTTQDSIEGNQDLAEDRSLAAYLQNISLLTSADADQSNQDTLKMMSVHAAKGLEFANVYVVGLEESLFPSQMSLYTREDLEEERRLFYVATTRAEQHLTLSYATSRYRFGKLMYCQPSRFLEEVPNDIVQHHHLKQAAEADSFERIFQKKPQRRTRIVKKQETITVDPNFKPSDPSLLEKGMTIMHQRFGKGKVQNIGGSSESKIAVIDFDSFGIKKIMLKFAKVQIVEK